ncbi:Osmotically-inducible protein OsmY, contains BON domain [Solitalea koreensis]|uniref:Osmotically-inducible protein OsmY, contains BON domain n=1 Tax=Solitalea koreensis TaxID=543615 RepID=A0A521AQI5_9SPHI|nr:Osmotically-inducible protein OsmY, contains BON domain [Solitalea koreensis]
MTILLFVLTAVTFTACKEKVKDDDIQSAIFMQLNSMGMVGIQPMVKDGEVTISGECKDEASKASLEAAIKSIKGVKSVVNNCTIAPPPPPAPPIEISTDNSLMEGVNNALKDYPTVRSDVKDGVITLTGEIKRSDLPKLMQTLNALKPKKVDNQLTIK